MKLSVDWGKPVQLRSGRRQGLIYTADLEQIPTCSGMYVFARRWGKGFEALYVGKSKNIRSRTKTHFNNLKLMRHIEDAKNGRRVVFYGAAITKPGQKIDRVLPILERAFIRHFLSEGHDLVNQQGVRIWRHEIESLGSVPRAFAPGLMYLEKAKGE